MSGRSGKKKGEKKAGDKRVRPWTSVEEAVAEEEKVRTKIVGELQAEIRALKAKCTGYERREVDGLASAGRVQAFAKDQVDGAMGRIKSLSIAQNEMRATLEALRSTNAVVGKRLRDQLAFFRLQSEVPSNLDAFSWSLEAPQGEIAFVWLDIEGSADLWDAASQPMAVSVSKYHHVLRTELKRKEGYEVVCSGDQYGAAFRTSLDAIQYCMDVQQLLLQTTWPTEITALDAAAPMLDEGKTRYLFRGPRVRMGVHFGTSDAETDDLTLRCRYAGAPAAPVLAAACCCLLHRLTGCAGETPGTAKSLCSAASGGQVLLSGETWARAADDVAHCMTDLDVAQLGEHDLPGDAPDAPSRRLGVVQILPPALKGRIFAALGSHAVLSACGAVEARIAMLLAQQAEVAAGAADLTARIESHGTDLSDVTEHVREAGGTLGDADAAAAAEREATLATLFDTLAATRAQQSSFAEQLEPMSGLKGEVQALDEAIKELMASNRRLLADAEAAKRGEMAAQATQRQTVALLLEARVALAEAQAEHEKVATELKRLQGRMV